MKDGHRTLDPKQSNYTGVVTWDSIYIALTYTSLNEFGVKAVDVKNSYLQGSSLEKHYDICNDDFGIESGGKVALIRRSL